MEGCEVLGIVVPWKGAAASKCRRCLQRLRVQRGQSQICDKGRDLGVIIDTQTAQEKSKYCTIASSPTVNDKMMSLTRLTCIDSSGTPTLPTAEGRFVSVTGIKGYSGWLSRDDPTRPCTSGIAPVLGAGITPTLSENKEGN